MRAVSESCRLLAIGTGLFIGLGGASASAQDGALDPATEQPARNTGDEAEAQVAPPSDLDPDADMAPLPDLDIDWPDLDEDPAPPPTLTDEALSGEESDKEARDDAVAQSEQGDDAGLNSDTTESVEDVETSLDSREADYDAFLGEAGIERDYFVRVEGIEDSEEEGVAVMRRFGELSELDARDGEPALIAQINRRAEQDSELLYRLLRIDGFYDALVAFEYVPDLTAENVEVLFTVTPGVRYPVASVALPGLSAADQSDVAMLRDAFPLYQGDPADQDDIVGARSNLSLTLSETGYPFADVGDPVLTVDHEIPAGLLDMPVSPGGKRNFGKIVVPSEKPFGGRHLQRIARFDNGDLYKESDVEDLRRAIIATGLVSQVSITPVDSGDGETVDIDVAMTPAPPRTIAGEIGFGTGEGFRAEASWEHRNFFPPEGLLRVRAVAGTREQLGHIVYRRNNWMRRDQVLTAQALASTQRFDAYDANIALVSATLERKTTLIFQKRWTWSIGAELAYSAERPSTKAANPPPRTTYRVAALPASLAYDDTEDLLDPQSGFRLGGNISPEFSLATGSDTYVRAQVDGSYYQPMSENIVLAGRLRLGTIVGAATSDIAPSRRNYSGGGGSVRGYGYQAIGPRDANNEPVGGRGLVEMSLEARIRLDAFGGNFGVVPFVDIGNVYDSAYPDFSGMRIGAGVGIRYYTNFGPIRVDVGTPVNPRPGDPVVAVYVSLGQAF